MKFEEVQKHVNGVPFIEPRNAEKLYNFIIENGIKNVLELGFAHGTASCIIAAALEEVKDGKLVCVDLEGARDVFKPSIEDQLSKTGLGKNVTVFREMTGYNWFLRNEITRLTTDQVCTPQYDLCIIDGPKNWTIDGAAFFMVDKILNNGGWVIFDDYTWTYAANDKKGEEQTDGITHRHLSKEELTIPQIKEVFQLLVMQHPNYHNFKIHGEGDWAWAQKSENGQSNKKVSIEYSLTYKDGFSKLFGMINKVFKIKKI